jgi:aminoglycoside N3'-acetyltransferase
MAARGETGGGGETTATAVRTGWLETDLRELGLQSGDQVVVHSSFKSIGPVEGGPVAVVEALLAVLGPSGTLVLPTFTHSGTQPQQGAQCAVGHKVLRRVRQVPHTSIR